MPTRHTVSVDGEKVIAVHHEAGGDRWLFFSHGFVSDKSGSYVGRCERAVEEGYDAVRFDHRGCGESDGRFEDTTLGGRTADLRAVIDYFDPDSCALFGSSLGGKAAFHVAVDDGRVEGVATRAPVTYNRVLGEREGGAEFFGDLDDYPFAQVVKSLNVPVAIFHGREDSTVPAKESLDAVGELDTDATFVAYSEEGHGFSRGAEERMRDTLFAWLTKVL